MRKKIELAVLTFVGRWMLRATGAVVQAIGRRLPRDVDVVSGKDRRTGARIG